MRPWTAYEAVRLVQLSFSIERTDKTFAGLLLASINDDSALPPLHDRAIELGKPKLAESIRRLLEGR